MAIEQQSLDRRVQELNKRYEGVDGQSVLRALIEDEFLDRICVLSSFGAESVVLLDVIAEIDRCVPVIFLDTGKLFAETIAYRDEVVSHLGLSDLRIVKPDPVQIEARDPEGILWYWDPDSCCALRKVEPLPSATRVFDAVISGRKRYHGAMRSELSLFELVDGQIKTDPLASWTKEQVAARFEARKLPRHPLVAQGYPSIGCEPCTSQVAEVDDVRAGRWAGKMKTECGIHLQNGLG
jgi:phosphoadenosine phosphosulfate reductase